MAGNQETVPVSSAVIDAKPLRTLTPMFPAPLGLHTFTPQNTPSFVCVTPFGPYAGGTEAGMPTGIPPIFATPAAPVDPNQRPPSARMNGPAHGDGSTKNTSFTHVTDMPSTDTMQESGKRKRGRPRRVQNSAGPSIPSGPSVPLVPSVPSVPSGNDNSIFQTPPTAITQESGKRKRGRPRRVQDSSVPSALPAPPVPSRNDDPVLQTPLAVATQESGKTTTQESGKRKRGRPRRVQGSSAPSAPSVYLGDGDVFQTPPAPTTGESGKRKRGRPKRVPESSVAPSGHSGPSGDDDTGKTKAKRGRPRKIDTNLLLLPSLTSDDPRETVDNVLMTYDALRRRLMQLDEAKETSKRHNLKAGSIMMNADLRANKIKRIGDVPGVEVGDMFYFRIEMCLVGLNSQSIAGIDYMSAKFGDEEDPVAISVVSSGVYENTEDDPDILVYTGQGMSAKDDQKLERGNLALERSLHRGNPIRVIRSVRDFTCPTGKIYIYDGLYKIKEAWVEKGKSGFNVFKHKLLREPGQPDGIAAWKKTEKWRENPPSRDHVILPDISYGVESKPVCLVNEVDDEKGPGHFTYTTRLNYKNTLSSMRKMQGCKCMSVCLPGDDNCSCTHRNAGDLPYSAASILVSRMPMLYECNDSCSCSLNCRNRVVQKGSQLHFEVFKTGDRGWGLRSWDPIRAGTFICEYAGEVVDKNDINGDDDYIFQIPHSEQTLRWNYAPELLGEPSLSDLNETSKQLPIIISGKRTGNISRFMNHSCSPNVFWQPVLYDHGDEGYPHIGFFAIKHIPPMTELTYDYGQSQGSDPAGTSLWLRKPKNCLCWSRKCRGTFG